MKRFMHSSRVGSLRRLWCCSGRSRRLAGLMPAMILLAQGVPAYANDYIVSTDVAFEYGGRLQDDAQAAVLISFFSPPLVYLGGAPDSADLDGYDSVPGGTRLLTFDGWLTLGALTVGPADVVRFDGISYTKVFDGLAAGVPRGANVDAVSQLADDRLLLSFDVSLTIGGVPVDDEDVIVYDTELESAAIFLDGSVAGVSPSLDIDAVHVPGDGSGQVVFLSFDGSGSVGEVPFEDEDVLVYFFQSQSWAWALRPGGGTNEWSGTDTDALSIALDSDGDLRQDWNDNCSALFNPSQRDTDGDGFGNRCDADLNDDCIINPTDLGLLRTVFFSTDPDADFDGNGSVNPIDLGIMASLFFEPPGLSGIANDCGPQ